jgi:hypothetical protein
MKLTYCSQHEIWYNNTIKSWQFSYKYIYYYDFLTVCAMLYIFCCFYISYQLHCALRRVATCFSTVQCSDWRLCSQFDTNTNTPLECIFIGNDVPQEVSLTSLLKVNPRSDTRNFKRAIISNMSDFTCKI